MYYISKKYLNNLTFNIPKIDFSNLANYPAPSGGIFAGAGFLPDLEKVPAGAEIRYSPNIQSCAS